MKPFPRIVAGRAAGLRRTKEYLAVRERLRAEARAAHSAELKAASVWRRLAIWWEMEREVRRALDKIYPPGALYTAGGPR
jgi:hypothetical protein